MDISIFIPCYNCAEKVLFTYQKIKKVCNKHQISFQCIFGDDNSSDNTRIFIKKILKKNKNHKIIHVKVSHNQGLGVSLKKAINLSIGKHFMWIPGDNDISLDGISKLVQYRKKADMVIFYIVNRFMRGKRNILSSIYNFIYMISFKQYLLYVTSPGIYNCKLLKSIDLKSKRFGVISELNIKMYFKSKGVIQIPVFQECPDVGSIKLHDFIDVVRSYISLLLECYLLKKINLSNEIKFIKI